MLRIVSLVFIVFCGIELSGQQVPDLEYNPPIEQPSYAKGKGAVVFIDEGHHNFHTKDGRYSTFARLVERDGYVVEAYSGEFEMDKLQKGKILVISNALHESNAQRWIRPIKSAFTDKEIDVVYNWVKEGGALFLIADHMPLAGAALDLAHQFGFSMTDGFVMRKDGQQGPAIFNRRKGNLNANIITNGRTTEEAVEEVATFTGQAFQIPENATSILNLTDDYHNLLPDTAWAFSANTPIMEVDGWSQGAYMKFGKGRIVVFGEAAMFSGQLAGPNKVKMGMNNPIASENHQLLLNIIRWLDGLFD